MISDCIEIVVASKRGEIIVRGVRDLNGDLEVCFKWNGWIIYFSFLFLFESSRVRKFDFSLRFFFLFYVEF